jgi:hypothetical protein
VRFGALGEDIIYAITDFDVDSPGIVDRKVLELGEAGVAVNVVVAHQSLQSVDLGKFIPFVVDAVQYFADFLLCLDHPQ